MDRRLSAVPRGVRWALAGAFVRSSRLPSLQPAPSANAEALPTLPSASVLRIASLGDPIALAQMLTLYLQAFDNQPGVSIPFLQLDYARVENWLERILELDPVGPVPAAARVAGVRPGSRRAQAAADAGARLPAFPCRPQPALALARACRDHGPPSAQGPAARAALRAGPARPMPRRRRCPSWARQMEIFLREDMGEYEAAKVLLGGLLAGGTVTDSHELAFLAGALEAAGGRREIVRGVEKVTAADEPGRRPGPSGISFRFNHLMRLAEQKRGHSG